jgi:hypothetical protein
MIAPLAKLVDWCGLFKFPSPKPCEFAENNVVHGRLYRCPHAWQKRPVIVFLHGAVEYLHYRFGYALLARRCNRAGFTAATLVAPYHFQRRVRRRIEWDHLQSAEPFELALSQPVIPKEHILLIQGRYDLCARAEYTDELWQKWKQQEIWRLPHGHLSCIFPLMFSSGLTNRLLRWLAPRLDNPFSPDRRTPPNQSLHRTAAQRVSIELERHGSSGA